MGEYVIRTVLKVPGVIQSKYLRMSAKELENATSELAQIFRVKKISNIKVSFWCMKQTKPAKVKCGTCGFFVKETHVDCYGDCKKCRDEVIRKEEVWNDGETKCTIEVMK